jgi:hypothetical protein
MEQTEDHFNVIFPRQINTLISQTRESFFEQIDVIMMRSQL